MLTDSTVYNIDTCFAKCLEQKFDYFGLSNGGKCWCSNEFGRLGKAEESKCNIKCTSNQN